MSNANWESQLSVLEKNTFLDYFKKVDADNKGIVLHDEAMDFLKKSDIPQNILTQFWNASDNENKGFLTEQEFCTILKLIACAQHGVMTGDPILATKAPLPEFNGTGSVNNNQNNNNSYNRPTMPPPPQTPVNNSNVDIISPEDRQKYIGLFNSFGPENNILSGDRARAAFVQSNLPPATLQTIWNLADTRKSGSLNQTEFIIAMFYIERAMKGNNTFPPTLPASVYASATGRPVASPLVRNNTLQVNSPPPIPIRSPVFKGRTVAPVVIAPEEYLKYKTFFNQLDTDNSGFVSGADAVVFFRHSKLPESDLARIWDLADTNSSGQLNEQEFAMAMHMINRRVAGGEIPNTLPAFNTMGDFNAPQQHQQHQQQQQQQQNVDLLGLNSDFTGIPAPAPPLQQTQPPQQLQQNFDLARSQSTLLQSNISTETNRAHTAQQQFGVESQAVQELLHQIEKQKETLTKMKAEAEEAERQLEQEKKRKEELTQELQMYRQETKHFMTRAEHAQKETKKVKSEIQDLEKEKAAAASAVVSPSTSHHDVFSLSSAPSPATGGGLFAKVNDTVSPAPGGLFVKVNEGSPATPSGLFAKVNEPSSTSTLSPSALFAKVNEMTSPVSAHSTGPIKTFDPFAGFKASNSTPSPKVSMNKLKEETEQQKRSTTPNSNLDISEIESKFPDLSTMEQNFAPPSPASTAPAPAPAVSSPSVSTTSAATDSLFKKTQVTPVAVPTPEKATNPSVSKYGFDLSAFETSSSNNASPFGDTSTMKDELSSLFSSPATSTAQLPAKTTQGVFDDIFGNSSSAAPTQATKPSTNSFEDIFFQK